MPGHPEETRAQPTWRAGFFLAPSGAMLNHLLSSSPPDASCGQNEPWGTPMGCACPAVAAWLEAHTPAFKAPDPSAMAREKQLARLSVVEYLAQRKAGSVTCLEYAEALVKRMVYYKYMSQFMYWDSFPNQTEVILQQARALDAKAAEQGVEAIAPLYGLPFPVKGTVATTDFPSSAGSGVLQGEFAVADAAMVRLLRSQHAVIMGKVPSSSLRLSLLAIRRPRGLCLSLPALCPCV